MHRPSPSAPNRKARHPGYDTGLMSIYGPVLWLMGWFIRMALRGRAVPPTFEAAQETPRFHNYRHLRRAQAACLRRAYRHMKRWGKPVNPDNYTPRAFAHLAYVNAMPKHWSIGRFKEGYARDTGLGRARVFGLSAAHEITSVAQGGILAEAMTALCAQTANLLRVSPLSLAAPTDPAPP